MNYKFIDLFAGIGGFHLAFHDLGHQCVFASEIDKFARETYKENFAKLSPNLFHDDNFNDDITAISPETIPDFDILCAGFPCQPFSQAGHKRGFGENYQARGNMFFHIRDIIKEKRPKAIFLENVRHLVKHDEGRTFGTIKQILEKELQYTLHWKIVKASDYGLPQHRPRVFIIGFRKEDKYPLEFEFAPQKELDFTMDDVWGGKCNKKIGFTLRVGGKGSGINDRRNWDCYLVDGVEKTIGIEEGKKMMGYPESFTFPVSKAQAMKQLGNSVAVNAVKENVKQIAKHLNTIDQRASLHVNMDKGCFETEVKTS
jgi:DNA (cytosine-5)-methyltransferase 1